MTGERLSAPVCRFCGSWWFIGGGLALTTTWVLLNIGLLVGEFDPYPFVFYNLVLTVVSTFQGPLIMMSQNRQADRDRAVAERDRQMLLELLRRLG